MNNPPQYFWRVQHDKSFTRYTRRDGFFARSMCTPRSYWLNKARIERHMDPNPLWYEATALISVFDNEKDAMECARSYVRNKHSGVTISQIDTWSLRRKVLEVQDGDKRIGLPGWSCGEDVIFVSNPAVRQYLNVDFKLGHFTEWLALGSIPPFMILNTTPYGRPRHYFFRQEPAGR